MFGKNLFRTFLYIVVSMVLVKLCYNLGYRAVNKKLGSAKEAPRSRTNILPGMSPDPADSAEMTTTPSQANSSFK